MQTKINGNQYSLDDVHPDDSACTFIREQVRLTGTKQVCGAGVCGACTVLVDDVPMTSCLLSAYALNDHSVQTIEAHSEAQLHPVQKALMACDGLQCGFCTPGFVMEGIAFYERWRQQNGTATPSRQEIASALSGHLCRCGAYIGIYEAIQQACAGHFDHKDVSEPPRVDALEKVTGHAQYTVDVHYDGQLEGKLLRSPYPHARIRSLDASAASNLPGVQAIVDMLDTKQVVRYAGQSILAVAAIDQRTAEEALEHIKIDYEILPASIGMDAAQAQDAPLVYPERKKEAPSASEGVLVPGSWKENVRHPILNVTAKHASKARRLIEDAHKSGEGYLVEGSWQTEAQVHTAFEPHSCVALWNDETHLTVHASTQSCDLLAREIAEKFHLSAQNVRVLCPYIGGAFGAKLRIGPETIAAIRLSKATGGTPVRVALSRQEELSVTGFRPATKIQLAMHANKQGQLEAMTVDAYADAGIAIGSQTAALMSFMYGNAPRDLVDYDVVNHTPPGTPFRGPGGPVACWALEQAVDEIAHMTGENPLSLRRRWDTHPLRQKLYAQVDTLAVWRERGPIGGEKGRFRRGVGLAAANWFYFYHPETQIEIRTAPTGITVQTAAQDMGNGTRTVLAHAVAGVFNIAPTDVHVMLGDSQSVRGPLSGGSRTTNSVFAPAQAAALRMRNQLVLEAKQHFNWSRAQAISGGIEHPGGVLSWREALKELPPQKMTAKRGHDHGLPAVPLAFGADGLQTGRGFTGAVHVTEVEVDMRLGKIKPLRVWGGLAVGKIVSPVLARSQCYGGVIQGLGYALYEQRQIDTKSGHILSANLEDYRIPGIGDIPEIEIFFLEEGFEHAEGQGVGLSELSTLPVAASVGNAIFHATGWRPYHLPVLPERLLEGVTQ